MEIDYIVGPKTDKIFGMSKYQNEIHKRIKSVDYNVIEYDSLTKSFESKYRSLFPVKSDFKSNNHSERTNFKDDILKIMINTAKDFTNSIDRYRYSNLVKKRIMPDNVKHIIYQDLAYLLDSIKLDKSIVTCHDLIPWVYERNRSKFWKNNINGLKKADRIITVSQFSKNEIIKHLKYPENKIYVVPDAVDRSIYYKKRDKRILNRLNIHSNEKIVLYVGSEEPRQNVDKLINAFAKLKEELPEIKLIKIGDSNLYGAREKLLGLVKTFNLENDIFFIGQVSEDELPRWYNAADLFVYPCTYAGFGLPPLEAMACGIPVITSNMSSLPEVVGDAGIMVDPLKINALADNMYKVITDDDLGNEMSKKGLKRAKLFNWNESAQKTIQIYKEML